KFFSLSYFDSPHILSVHFVNSNHRVNDRVKSVQLLYSDHYFNKSYKEGKTPDGFLFTYQDVSENFPSIIKLWLQLFNKIGPAINLFNELLLKRQYPLELKFLSAIQAIETFHRNIFGGEAIPKEHHEKRIRLIID